MRRPSASSCPDQRSHIGCTRSSYRSGRAACPSSCTICAGLPGIAAADKQLPSVRATAYVPRPPQALVPVVMMAPGPLAASFANLKARSMRFDLDNAWPEGLHRVLNVEPQPGP